MKRGFKNALPWIVLLTLVLISAGVSLSIVEGYDNLESNENAKTEKEKEKEKEKI
jgi:hypothetical protein